MMRPSIPNSAPWITQREIDAVVACLEHGAIASNERNRADAVTALKQWTRGHDVLLTPSCTLALEMALHALHLQPGDEVILPSFTFVSCSNAVLRAGGKPIFVDIEDRTLNLDIEDVRRKMGPKTRAVMPVHYAGVSCDMDDLLQLANANKSIVVEDAAHAIGAKYKGRPLGTLGHFGALSFHDTKNCVCGEGGALVINDTSYKQELECMYDKGTNRKQFMLGQVNKYTWVTPGSSYAISAILAALLKAQLDRLDDINARRNAIFTKYREELQPLVDRGDIYFSDIPSYASHNAHIAYFLMRDASKRDSFIAYMNGWGIGVTFHYIPLHLSPYATQHLGTKQGEFPVTERCAASLVRLPLFPHMTEEETAYVIDATTKFFLGGNVIQAPVYHAQMQTEAKEETLDFSLVLPCYQEEGHIKNSLDEILRTLDRLQISYEIILIDDCSRDSTAEKIREYQMLHPAHRIRSEFHEKNCGRGATVMEGFRMAKGRYVGFLDIDLEVHAHYIPAALLKLQSGVADVVIADRSYQNPILFFHRSLMSSVYRWMVRSILCIPPMDTEAGCKFFIRREILPVLDRCEDKHWFWDTEVSVRSYDAGLRIQSLPVLFIKREEKKTTVKFFHDSWRSLKALLRFRKERKALH